MRGKLAFLGWALACGVASAKLEAPLRYAAIEGYLAAHPKITSMEAFLDELPPVYGPHASLMFRSESLQEASPERPRVILFEEQGDLVMAFNGDPAHRKHDAIEMMAFDEKAARFELRELVFRDGHATLSAPNPVLCLGCHGQDPRPIWSPYPFWRGAIEERRHQHDDTPIKAREKTFFSEFKDHPRYKILKDPDRDPSNENIVLTHVLYERNFQRLKRVLHETAFFDDYKFALAGVLLCHNDGEKPMSEVLGTYLPKALLARHLEGLNGVTLLDDERTNFTYLHGLFDVRGITTRLWAAQADVVDSEALSRYAVTNQENFPSAAMLALQVLKTDPDFQSKPWKLTDRAFSDFSRKFKHYDSLGKEECQTLAGQSQKKLEALLKLHSPDEIFEQSRQAQVGETAFEILQRCVTCHKAEGAPQIPFDSAVELGKALHANEPLREAIHFRLGKDAGDKAMPPGHPLSEQERAAVLEFLGKLGRD